MRVVLDTNVIVSNFLSPTGAPAEIVRRWRQERFGLVVSTHLLGEYRRALGYERVRMLHGMTSHEIEDVVSDLRRFATVVEPRETITVIDDDPDDNRVLECASAGDAEFAISGDRHLLKLRICRGIRILSPAEFLAHLDALDLSS